VRHYNQAGPVGLGPCLILARKFPGAPLFLCLGPACPGCPELFLSQEEGPCPMGSPIPECTILGSWDNQPRLLSEPSRLSVPGAQARVAAAGPGCGPCPFIHFISMQEPWVPVHFNPSSDTSSALRATLGTGPRPRHSCMVNTHTGTHIPQTASLGPPVVPPNSGCPQGRG
jgi:hypothetical protein